MHLAALPSAPPTATPTPLKDVAEDEVRCALLILAHERLRTSVLWTLAVGPLFTALLPPLFPTRPLVAWGTVLLFVGLLRLMHSWQWQRQSPAVLYGARARQFFVAGAVMAGLSWSLGPLLLLPAGPGETMLLLLILLAVGAVATTALAAQPVALWGFVLAALGPVIVCLVANGGRTEAMAATALTLASLALLMAGRVTGRATRRLLHAELQLSHALTDKQAALQQAEAASQAKSRFLATMSHELRTPLNAVIGAAQLLRADDGDMMERHHLIDAIQRSGGNLLGLIEDILDLTRIEAGQHRLDVQDFHLGDCIDAALTTAALGAHAKGLLLACRIDPAVPQRCRGDAARLRQLLLNLLGNAVKFTPAGEVLLRVDTGDAPGELRLQVQDSGVGIAPQALAHIFEPFRQGDEGTGRRFGGSGLGLAIVQQLVQAMGGRIEVDSQPGAGACFTLWLPLPAVPVATPAMSAAAARPVAFVEPHGASAAGLDALLRRLGCKPTSCADAIALRAWCVAHAGHQPAPRLLLCTDNPQAADLLEAVSDLLDPSWVIGMTRHDGQDLQTLPGLPGVNQRRQRCSLPASLAKPVAGAALAARLDATSAAPAQAPEARLTRAEPGAQVHVLVVEDDPLNRSIVTRLLSHANCRVSTAENGLQALDLLQAIDTPVDLVLMDWHMPGMDGLEVTRRLRAGAAGGAASRLPIVALTANAFAEDRAACLAAGMNDFLTKPVLAQTLLATVARWAERPLSAPRMAGAPGAEDAAAAAAAARPSALPAYDPGVLRALPMVADGSQPDCLDEMLDIFNTGLADLLTTLPARLRQRDAAAARLSLHSLKSSAACVGALALSALAAEGEALLQELDCQATPAALDNPAIQALPDRLREASAQWHLALAQTPRPALPAAPAATAVPAPHRPPQAARQPQAETAGRAEALTESLPC
jgi:signal transduction histidine kinase/CheY-like chemotaxis protein/HPt (histidine-containing phosphotransfer) domain-containing protein